MAFAETVVSIVESTVGEITTRVAPMEDAKYVASATAAWIARIEYLRRWGMYSYIEDLAASFIGRSATFQAAMAELAAREAAAQAATIAAADAAAVAAEGTLVAGAGTTAAAITVPIVAMAAVGVALGAPYYQARQEAKKNGHALGFAKGFVTGLIKWPLANTVNLFWDWGVNRNPFDEALPTIYANAHNKGPVTGRLAGVTVGDNFKKTYLKALIKLSHASAAGWDARSLDWREQARARQVHISYTIEMAIAGLKRGILTDD